MSDQNMRPYRSLFWPMLLIGVGVVWFLHNINILPTLNFGLLFRLWPVILIGIGLDIIFARRSPLIGSLIGLAVVAIIIVLLLAAPALGISQNNAATIENFSAPLGDAQTATFDFNLSMQSAHVSALGSSPNLVEAKIGHYGTADFQTSGGTEKTVLLQVDQGPWYTWGLTTTQNMDWEIGLSRNVVWDLKVNASAGSAELDLQGLELKDLSVDGSAGSMDISLPQSTAAYTVEINGSAGSIDLAIPQETNVTVHLDGSAGSIGVNLPPNAAVHIEVLDNGAGSVSIPSGLTEISRGEGDMGVWESAEYNQAAAKIQIYIDHVSAGSISLD
jgi:hypothetical protein